MIWGAKFRGVRSIIKVSKALITHQSQLANDS